MVSESPSLVGNWKERLWAYLRRYQMVAFRLGPHVLFLILHVHILCLLCLSCCYYLMFLFFLFHMSYSSSSMFIFYAFHAVIILCFFFFLFHLTPSCLSAWLPFTHTHSSVCFPPTTTSKYPVLFHSNLCSMTLVPPTTSV